MMQNVSQTPRVIILMGVSGCGKSTFGELLKRELKFVFKDGDDLHSPQNIAKMASGIALNDDDRQPWLEAICRFADSTTDAGRDVAVACSALKKVYRDQLRKIAVPPKFIHLVGDIKTIGRRQSNRAGHFMPASLLQSQFDAIESTESEPDVFEVPINLPLLEVERRVLLAAKN